MLQPVAMAEPQVNTIADIARLAGVSKATVSRALNDSPLISAETKERVRTVARRHRFEMNVPARRLSLGLSNTVGLVTYAYRHSEASSDVFMLEILSGLSSALHERDYDLLVIQVDPDDADWVRRYADTGRVDGFVLLAASCKQQHLTTLLDAGAPFVLWGETPSDRPHCSVTGDSVTGGRVATEHLLGGGRARIAFLGGPAKAPEVQDRYAGYEAALRAAGREVDPALVVHAPWYRPEVAGADAMRMLLERAPDLDAVFANSDLMALAALDVLRDAGRRVPEDVAVVGYDDVSLARHSDPPLTTVRQNGPLAGRLLAETLLRHLETGVVTNVSIPAELVVRRSA
jgi:DNA-binding LacI/PurR family transcriptional regulator